MKIDLHIHTDHSFDGRNAVETVLKRAEEEGLDAVAITDHDTMSAVQLARQATKNVTIIPGMEITTTAGGTHIVGLFLQYEIASRDIDEVIDDIHEQGGLVLLPHPFRRGTGLMYNRDHGNDIDGETASRIMSKVDLIELFNYRCSPEAVVDTDRFIDLHPNIAHASGSDAHLEDEIGKAYIELEDVNSGSLEEIKDALLYSPRLLRYEAYTERGEAETKTTRIKGRKKSLIIKTRDFIPRYIRKSLRAIYKKSASKLPQMRKEKTTAKMK